MDANDIHGMSFMFMKMSCTYIVSYSWKLSTLIVPATTALPLVYLWSLPQAVHCSCSGTDCRPSPRSPLQLPCLHLQAPRLCLLCRPPPSQPGHLFQDALLSLHPPVRLPSLHRGCRYDWTGLLHCGWAKVVAASWTCRAVRWLPWDSLLLPPPLVPTNSKSPCLTVP